MKRLLTLSVAGMMALCVSATDRYVATTGDDANDGLSWANAKATIGAAISASAAGDNVLVAAGSYAEGISVKDGVNVLGGYNAATGTRDIDAFVTVLEGQDLGKYLIVKYDSDCANPTLIEGLTLQNAEHENDGGGAYIRGNMTLNRCVIRNCHGKNGGGAYIRSKTAASPAVVSNTVIELCSSSSSGGGAYVYENAVMENCIVRGCGGKYGAIRNHQAGCIVRNCVVYNNSANVDGWPDSGGIFNEDGALTVNCTVCNNYGAKYAGIHSEGNVYNSIFWGNQHEEGFAEPTNYINGGNSVKNVADEGFGKSSAFLSLTLNANNTAATGPNFRNPTTFVGIPTNAGEIAAMQNADFHITAASTAFIDKADANLAPAADFDGVTRPKGSGVDVGAFEYDPAAPSIAVTGVDLFEDTLFIYEEQVSGFTVLIYPRNATNKRVSWTIDNPAVATVDDNGAITGVAEGMTTAHVTTQDGSFTDAGIVVVSPKPPVFYPVEVLAADSLYKQEDYTVPSFIPFLVAKEAARIDSATAPDVTVIAGKIQAMNAAIANLVGKEEPYNMIANINGDPKTRMAFCWFTNEGVTDGEVQLVAKADATADDFAGNGVITVSATPTTTKPLNYAVSTSGIIKAANINSKTKFTYVSHKAIAENLTPGTAYSWRVGYNGHWSDIAQFRTEDANQGEFTFVYMSDSHIMDQEYVDNARWCATAIAKNVPEARFCVFPGDFVETGTNANSEWEWERWFEESIRPVIMKMPVVPTDGNHDDSENLNYNYHFNTDAAFNAQSKVKPQFSGITYSFVYGDVLFFVFSMQDFWRGAYSYSAETSTYLTNDVGNWFKQQAAAHPNTKYRISLAHKNIFSGSGHCYDDETPMFRSTMLPVMKECEIDLALQGHDHCYEVIGPVDPDKRTVIASAIEDVQTVEVNTNTNMTGKKGGTFTTDDGTLYFIGATCGRKRYYPYDRTKLDGYYPQHKVTNYFDLFTSMFGQPGAPSFTKITVKSNYIEFNSYKADANGNAELFNTMRLVRNKPHTSPLGWEDMEEDRVIRNGEKFYLNGQVYIRANGHIYNAVGQQME